MSMRGLTKKRDELRLTIRRAQAQLLTIERAIELLGGPPPRAKLFARGELSRLVYDAMRQGAGDNVQITEYVITAMGWDAADHDLFTQIRAKVKDVTKRIAR